MALKPTAFQKQREEEGRRMKRRYRWMRTCLRGKIWTSWTRSWTLWAWRTEADGLTDRWMHGAECGRMVLTSRDCSEPGYVMTSLPVSAPPPHQSHIIMTISFSDLTSSSHWNKVRCSFLGGFHRNLMFNLQSSILIRSTWRAHRLTHLPTGNTDSLPPNAKMKDALWSF